MKKERVERDAVTSLLVESGRISGDALQDLAVEDWFVEPLAA